MKHFNGIGIKPIHTTCNCNRAVIMKWNGSWHSADCKCGANVRAKGGTLIIDHSPIKNKQ